MADEVHWKIVAGPEPQDPGDVDAESWIWRLEHVITGANVELSCTVTGPGNMEKAAAVSKRAHESKGRSEAEKALTEHEPPRQIVLGADGYMLRI